MPVLVTGASDYLGLAVSLRLQFAGYTVFGLTQSVVGAKALESRGITPLVGSVEDSDTLINAARLVEAVVDVAGHPATAKIFLSILQGTGKRYIRTSTASVYADRARGSLSSLVFKESMKLSPDGRAAAIIATDASVQDAAENGIHTVVLRPALTYGDAGGVLITTLLRQAMASGRSLYIGTGANRQSHVYRTDLAEAYFLALEKAPPGRVYNIADGESSMADIATGVSAAIGLPGPTSCGIETAYTAFGSRLVDDVLSSNCRVDATRAKIELGWKPAGPSLMDELADGSYPEVWSGASLPR